MSKVIKKFKSSTILFKIGCIVVFLQVVNLLVYF
jgi:hypothetical protein